MDDYMTKPLNKEIVMRMIGTWLSGNSRPVAAAPEAGDHTERLSSTDETLNELNQPPLPSQRVKL
jgi:hypothetical protein